MIGLVDGNNFFVSCERVFNRRLVGRPVAVLSNNDGCCVSRSNEFKALGIPMGTPYYQLKDREARGELDFCSSNYELYGDMSRRIVSILREEALEVEQYSIDEAFIVPPSGGRERLAEYGKRLRTKILAWVGIPCGVGFAPTKTLAKIANHMAKKMPADKDGVRIAELDEMSYRRHLWDHRPLTAFWRVGKGIAGRLAAYGIDTMGKIARCSVENEELLYRLFGVNAELLIDHAWGWESCTMEAVKAYRPETNSLSRGQVLSVAYDCEKARVVVKEMAENIALLLVSKRLVTNQIILTVSYDAENLTNDEIRAKYHGDVVQNYYGKMVPKHSHGTANMARHTSSAQEIVEAVMRLYDENVNPDLLVRRLNLTVNNVIGEMQMELEEESKPQQLDLFVDYEQQQRGEELQKSLQEKERRMQEAQIEIKKRFGKNAILKGLNFREGATARERNQQIGGHKG